MYKEMEILTNYNCMPALEVQGVPKNMRLRRRHGDVLANISERIKVHSINPNMEKKL